MVDGSDKLHLWRFEGVPSRDADLQVEATVRVRRALSAMDDSFELVHAVVACPRGDAWWWVLEEELELLLDAHESHSFERHPAVPLNWCSFRVHACVCARLAKTPALWS